MTYIQNDKIDVDHSMDYEIDESKHQLPYRRQAHIFKNTHIATKQLNDIQWHFLCGAQYMSMSLFIPKSIFFFVDVCYFIIIIFFFCIFLIFFSSSYFSWHMLNRATLTDHFCVSVRVNLSKITSVIKCLKYILFRYFVELLS